MMAVAGAVVDVVVVTVAAGAAAGPAAAPSPASLVGWMNKAVTDGQYAVQKLPHMFVPPSVVTDVGIVTVVKERHLRNAPLPMLVTDVGMATLVKELHSEKA